MPESRKPDHVYGLPGNTNKSKETPAERPLPERITTKDVIPRSKPLGKRIAESFTGDSAKTVGQYLLFDVVIPAAKALALDMLSQGGERLLYGDSRGRSRLQSGSGSRLGSTNYNKIYGAVAQGVQSGINRRDDPREMSPRARALHDFDDVVLADRGEAQGVLNAMQDILNEYDRVTVADLYSLIGVTPSFTDHKWGWTDLQGSRVDPVRGGFLMVMPKTGPLD